MTATATKRWRGHPTGSGISRARTFDGVNQDFAATVSAPFAIGDILWTLFGRFRVTDFSAVRGLVSKGNPANSGGEWALTVAQGTGIPTFSVRLADNSAPVSVSGPALIAGEDSIIQCTHDPTANTISIRVNLSFPETAAIAGGTLSASNTFRIGSLAGANYHLGRASDVAVWNRLLTADSEPDWIAIPKRFALWGQVGDDGADMLTDLVDLFEGQETGDMIGSFGDHTLTANNAPGRSRGQKPPSAAFLTAIDAIGANDITLLNFANAQYARDRSVPAGILGRSLRLDGVEEYGTLATPVADDANISYGGFMRRIEDVPLPLFGSTAGGYVLLLFSDGRLYVSDDNAGTSISINVAGFNITNWYHYVVTKAGSTVNIYVDGVNNPHGSGASLTLADFATVANFGKAGIYLGKGFYKDARIYSGVTLTESQVLEWKNGSAVTGATPTHQWLFNEVA